MGKKSKSLRHLKKMAARRAAKAAKAAQYAAEGAKKRNSSTKMRKRLGYHPTGPCGNIGCALCTPSMHSPAQVAKARAKYYSMSTA